MSNRYKGGVISATPPTTSGGNDGVASGAWTLEQQMQAQAAGLWPNQPVFYIEDVFSTYLYTGNGSTQTITNGIDLSGKGGLVWIKWRNTTYGSVDHNLYDTSRGVLNRILSNTTDAQVTQASSLTAFNSDGFSLGGTSGTNGNNANYVSWTFRKQPKFFDVVTYTGNGAASRNIAHNLGSVPGCIIVKETNYSGTNWLVYHQSLGNTKEVYLNTTDVSTTTNSWASTTPTSAVFTVNFSGGTGPNGNGSQYVAYLFAHDAGGFGLTGTDNVISCGSFTTDGSGNATVNLGYEPQWMLLKNVNEGSANWGLFDTLRGWTTDTGYKVLTANTSSAEGSNPTSYYAPTSTGIKITSASTSQTQIYIAIRRGPMRTPTVGTSVFNPVLASSTAPALRSSNFTSGVDSGIRFYTAGYTGYPEWSSRLTGTGVLGTSGTAAESTLSVNTWDYMNGYLNYAGLGTDFGSWMFKRAPSFFDEVCYTGTGSATTVTHNLTVAPELMIVKSRSAGGENWNVYSATLTATKYLTLNLTNAEATDSLRWNDTAPTSSVFSLGTRATVNGSGTTFVAYLFATCAGVSKVGSYTGTATTKQIDCGFTGGARFVLIKRTDSTGDWYVWDSARGIVSGNDPYLLLNSTAAEVTNTDYVDTYSAGFEISSTAPAAINANGGTFIFLAIA